MAFATIPRKCDSFRVQLSLTGEARIAENRRFYRRRFPEKTIYRRGEKSSRCGSLGTENPQLFPKENLPNFRAGTQVVLQILAGFHAQKDFGRKGQDHPGLKRLKLYKENI